MTDWAASKPQMWQAWDFESTPKELCCFALPFGGGSKNAMHITTRKGRKVLSDSARKFKADVGILAMHAARDVKFKPGKIWLSIFVEMPTARTDAINLLDLIADGVQDGIGINDRNYSIWRLDSEVVKFDPQIYIALGQW